MAIAIDIVSPNSQGMRHSAEMVHRVLSRSFPTEINLTRRRNALLLHRRLLKGLANRLVEPRRILLFLEKLPTAWMGLAKTRILIPNQEFIWEETRANLAACSQIWCKTLYANGIFKQRGYDTRFVGFSSQDAWLPDCRKDYSRFIHVAGKSPVKGTRTILELWRKHSDWPLLQVVTADAARAHYEARNILVRPNNLPERELYALMNESGIHLCPSEAEGFGHYISEALSTKALVISTDAPPMNEVVRPEYGLLTNYCRVETMGFGERFFVDPNDLEQQIETALQMSAAEKSRLGDAARQSYLERDAAFAERLTAAANELLVA